MRRLLYFLLLLFVQTIHAEDSTTITLLSVNDMHASIEWFPQLANIVDSVRAKDSDLLLLSAGDNRTGNPINDRYKEPSYPMTALMNAVGFDASAVGNHEFDAGIRAFRTQIDKSKFSYLCANMAPLDSLYLKIKPYQIFEKKGLKIGVLSLIQLGENGIPSTYCRNVEGIQFINEKSVLAQYYDEVRSQCDLFILLSHCGYDADREFANLFPQIDLIIGGHSHTRLEGTQFHGKVLITQAENKLKYVTLTHITIKDKTIIDKRSQLIDIRKHIGKNKDIEALVDSFEHDSVLEKRLTVVETDLTSYDEMGYLECLALQEESKTDIAIINAGAIRYGELAKGYITIGDVLRLDPFNDDAIIYELTIKELKEMIKECRAHDKMRWPFVAGIQYTVVYGKNNPTEVINIEIRKEDGTPLDKKRYYQVVTNSYVPSITHFKHRKKGTNLHQICSDMVINYLSKQSSVDYRNKRLITEVER